MKNEKIIEGEFTEENENMEEEFTENVEMNEAGEVSEEHEWTIKDLEELRKIRKAKSVLKKVAIGVTCATVVVGATIMVVKKIVKGDDVNIEEVRNDVKDLVEETVSE